MVDKSVCTNEYYYFVFNIQGWIKIVLVSQNQQLNTELWTLNLHVLILSRRISAEVCLGNKCKISFIINKKEEKSRQYDFFNQVVGMSDIE